MTHGEDNAVRSRRSASGGRRWNRVAVTFDDAELAEIRAAAGRSHMAVAAWLGRTGLSAASHEMPASEALRELLHAVIDAGTEARRQGVNLNQAVTQLHSAAGPRPAAERHLQRALDQVAQALTEVNAAMRRVRDRL